MRLANRHSNLKRKSGPKREPNFQSSDGLGRRLRVMEG